MTGDAHNGSMTLLPSTPTAKAPAERFTGDVLVDTITEGARRGDARIAEVRFSACARTAWHRHVRGQTLHVTDGQGLVQTSDGRVIGMVPGDTVFTPAGIWHWHGAGAYCSMTHLALADSSDDPRVPNVEWGALVTDAEYEAAIAIATADGRHADETIATAIDEPDVKRTPRSDAFTIAAQGSFAVGGVVSTSGGSFDARHPMDPAGQTLHGDHARVTFQVPSDARPLPLLFWHGWWEDSSCWDTTPDGREGFRAIFLRRGFPVYLLDQPRRGSAGKTTAATPIAVDPNEQWFFNQFRLGQWPALYESVQFPPEPDALEQFFRGMVPDTGPIDAEVLVAAASAAIDRIGPVILVTHSHAGGFGWLAQMSNHNVRAVVSMEPGSGFVFPEDEVPAVMPSSNGTLEGVPVLHQQFDELTRVPIVLYYGDNIPTEPTDIAGRDNWRVRQAMAEIWVETINRHGGDATFVSLPERGIHGNTHFAFSDLNNLEIADQIATFLADKALD
jgi:quercetin dioxygenase-like cupin family protein